MKNTFICTLPVNEIVVLSDGRVTTCCLDPKGENTFADIYEDDFESTLSKFRDFKIKMVKNVNDFPICITCIKARKNYYNEFHKINPSEREIETFLAAEAIPRRLVIELTVACNMFCIACLSGQKKIKNYRKIENGLFLDTKKLKKWLAPYIDGIHSIRLFNYGETFLHPEAIEFCDFLTDSNPGIHLIIATNILPLDNDEKIKMLIKAQPNALYVSLHGANQDSVSKYMGPKADFWRAMGIMRKIITLRNEMGYEAPLVVWKYILFNWNDSDEEMQFARTLAKEYCIDFIGFEITNGNIASKRFYKGSEEFEALKKSKYFINHIYGVINQKKIKRVNHSKKFTPLEDKISVFSPFNKNSKTTIFHITHQKAGSQWVKAVFHSIDASRVVESKLYEEQFFKDPLVEGGIYPALYCTKEKFESVKVPEKSIIFVVIRDLRDTLISLYFSMRYSHPELNEFIQNTRNQLEKIDVSEGLIFLTDYIAPLARIQGSWIDSGELIVKYEELFTNEVDSFMKIFKYCNLKYPKKLLLDAIKENSFEKKSRGRKAGIENIKSHLRKGIPGDWKNYFSENLKDTFKKKYGEILIKTGYEKDLDW
jgi:lipopolysaccharide transport system ATP-binding protein